MPLSIAIITLNEEDRIARCLKSARFAEEILVVDSGSTDKTVEIARSFGARVLFEPWRGYAGQKQFAVDSCQNEWVLILDADERIPGDTQHAIAEIVADPDQEIAAYSFNRKNFFHNRWIRHCGWWPDRIVRLVHRGKGHFSDHLVHESWIADGPVKDLSVNIEHYSFRDYSDLIHKLETYSSLAARQMLKNGKSSGSLAPLSHGLWMFLRTYLVELGVLEGFDGLIISILNSGGSFMKYAKLRESLLHGHAHAVHTGERKKRV